MATTAPDMDVLLDSQPMNDEELTRLHESTLQMFRSNKIGPKNAFDIVLIDYLPAIFEASSFDDDRVNNFQSVGTTLETSAKIYAARIDSLYSETRKAQSILRSTNDNLNRMIDDDDDDNDDIDSGNNEEGCSQRRISNNKKIRLLVKRKKSIVTDRTKLLRKNRNDEFRPIMINQFFLSAMNNDNIMLSELYDKMNISSTPVKTIKFESNEVLATSSTSNDFVCESLYVDTTNASMILNDGELSPMSEMNTTSKSSQFLTPASLTSSSSTTLLSTPMRSRTNSISSNSSILINAANLLTDTPDEYSYLDSSKVNAFMNEISTSTKLDEVIPSPTKSVRKRRLTIEYPFPFLVEQAKKQRVTPKKLQQALSNQHLLSRPLSPEYLYSPFDYSADPPATSDDVLPPSHSQDSALVSNGLHVSKRQREIDFRRLQTDMHQMISDHFEKDRDLDFSEIFAMIHHHDQRATSLASDVGICFAALLNNAVRFQFVLESNDIRDDIRILPPLVNNTH